MRQLIQQRLKTNIIGATGNVQPRGNIVKKGGVGGSVGIKPIWSSIPDVSVPQGSPWTIDLNDYVTSSLQPVTFTISTGGLPTGITLNANGTFSGTVTNLGGAGSVTFIATNSAGGSESGTLNWSI